MIDDKTFRTMLEGMESAAEEALRDDAAFYKTLRSLKSEIDRDPRVQSAITKLHLSGSRIYSSLVPRVKVRIRTSTGEISLGDRNKSSNDFSAPVAHLTRELRTAANAVMMQGRYRELLDQIMNQAIESSDRFERIASEVERAGNEIVICLDLSTYARVQETTKPNLRATDLSSSTEPLARLLSEQDRKFLKDLKISAAEQ
jgi:hypothetical protein